MRAISSLRSLPLFLLASVTACVISWQGVRDSTFYIDKVHQVAAAQSLIDTGQLGYPRVLSTQDLSISSIRYEPDWPPGYPLALVALYPLTGSLFRAAVALDVFNGLLMFVGWWLTLSLLTSLRPMTKVLIWLCWLVWFRPQPLDTSSGVMALALLSLTLPATLKAVSTPSGRNGWSFVAGVIAGLTGWVRYAYWPMMAVPAAVLAIHSARGSGVWSIARWRSAALAALGASIPLLCLLLVNHVMSGELTYLDETYPSTRRGFFPERLLDIPPFVLNAFADPRILFAQIGQAWGMAVAWLGTIAFFVLLGLYACDWRGLASQGRTGSDGKREAAFVTFTALAILLTLGMLAFLALRMDHGSTWHYLMNARYYSPVFPFIVVASGLLLQELGKKVLGNKGWQRHLTLVSSALALVAVVAYLPFMGAVGRKVVRAFAGAPPNFDPKARASYNAIRKDRRDGGVVLSAAMGSHIQTASLFGVPELLVDPLPGAVPPTSKALRLYVGIDQVRDGDREFEKNLVGIGRVIGREKDYLVYRVDLSPATNSDSLR